MPENQCRGTTRQGAPCPRRALEGRASCRHHDPERMAVLARQGGHAKAAKERAAREALAAAVAVATVADLRALLLVAARTAVAEGDVANMLRAVSVGVELVKSADLEAQVAELRELVERHVRRGPTGVVR